MAHILGVEDVSIALGSRPILGNINVSIEDGAKIGIVGPNGGGKSTLLKLLTRVLEPDSGQVTMMNGTRFSVLSQAISFAPDVTVIQAIHGNTEEYVWASDSAIRYLHEGLLPDVPLDRRVTELSGGQRRRVALAATLAADANVVVLDEPTNHLDIEGVTFLAKYLNERFGRGEGALVVVTHDRWFLDAVCDRLWEVVPGNDGAGGHNPQPGHVETYEGGYAAYILQRAERARIAQQTAEKRNNILRKELAWLRRGAPARTSKPKFRIEAANELIANEPPPRDSLELAKMATSRLGKDVIDLIDVSFSYDSASDADDQKPVLDDVTLRLAPGERLGIVGGNGAGKSSLLGLISGVLAPTTGRVKRGKTVNLAVLTQETKELDDIATRRVVEAVHDIASHVMVGKKEMTAAQLVEKLGFTRERAWTQVGDLSGGERRRLQLLRLLVGEPNVLLLDEPTNDLDTDTLAAIEDMLDSWPGTLVVVSHDRYLLERITDHQVAVLDGHVRDLPGGVDEYVQLAAQLRKERSDDGDAGPHVAAPTKTKDAAKERLVHKNMARLERKMDKVRQQLEKIGLKQADAAASGDFEALIDLGKEAAEAQDELDALEEEWMAVAEEVEFL
ncbi:ATPase components of ABC transporters with duplicated ATPase domains [Arcanobacterium phocae]|uniref:ATPase components of ABC transporters with duplicated ATPase domains n=1 Tax=Arcanobacterium phocae TaxID=131112 RepID=A0A1H2LDA6_9ACTO|nr:ABC-F family ATP-binding cassette domain-containing protein [Arcanobacterium phocae]SDU79020.1 ATPase components of ABC transporters with duplicated ATPase domains [Arcanobacterium phocae]